MRELNPGDKVVRGPDWSYGNQDRNYFDDPDTPQIGIVERRTQADWYRVKWPNGHVNGYRCSSERAQVIPYEHTNKTESIPQSVFDAVKAVADDRRAYLVRKAEEHAQLENGPRQMTPEAQEAWSTTLRMKVQAAEKAKREQIKGPIDDPDYA